jgi:uncharacterized membrane protein YbhN (UPF0104 family)
VRAHRRAALALQMVAGIAIIVAFVLAVHGSWKGAGDRLRDADPVDFVVGCAVLAAYYLVFVLGWMRILAAWRIQISYGAALRAEMLSMPAKYVPGGVWTPAARVIAVRRAGVNAPALITASILLEAGLSAVAGVLVFLVSLIWVGEPEFALAPLIVFAVVVAVLLHPGVFHAVARFVFRRFGQEEPPRLPGATLVSLIVFYCGTWVIGGLALFFLVRAVGGTPGVSSIVYLGGVSAVGAIVAVLSIIAPSGLGPREASMYALMLAVVNGSSALGATVLNRVAITVVEALLLLGGGLFIRRRGEPEARRLPA